MTRTYVTFDEIENELKVAAPKIVYKYRTWKDKNHKSLLMDCAVWFSHPFDLNDPLDVRPETVFDMNEIYDPRYLEKLIEKATHMHTERDRRIVGEKRWEEIKMNPNMIVENHRRWNQERKNFDRYGVFSTAINELNEEIWEEYGDHHAGYSVGFNTVELCRQMKSGYGYITYSDDPYVFRFLDKVDDGLEVLYLKKNKWRVETEFRFITGGVDYYSKRLQFFTPQTVSKVILGYAMSAGDEKEILEILAVNYPADLPVYRTKRDDDGRLIKEPI